MKKIKNFGVVLLFAIIGGFLGYFIPFIHDDTNLHIPDLGLLVWLPIIISLFIAIIFFQKGKTKIHKGIDNDKNFEDANKFLCLSLGFITLTTPLFFITITLGFKNFLDESTMYTLVQFLFMIIFSGLTTYLQRKIITLSKILFPEKKGDVFDINFHKDWMSSMDEAELSQVYRSSYFSFRIMNSIYPILLFILFIMSCANIISVTLPLAVGFLWITQFCLYFSYAYHLEHGKRTKHI